MRPTIHHLGAAIVSAVVRVLPWLSPRVDPPTAAPWDPVAVGSEVLTAHTTGLWRRDTTGRLYQTSFVKAYTPAVVLDLVGEQAEILTMDGRQGLVDLAELAVVGTGD